MKFRVGQKVRLVRANPGSLVETTFPHLLGLEGVITAIPSDIPGGDCVIRVNASPRLVSTLFCHIEPLSDPRADSFIETVKSWGPLKEQPQTPEEVLAEIIKECK